MRLRVLLVLCMIASASVGDAAAMNLKSLFGFKDEKKLEVKEETLSGSNILTNVSENILTQEDNQQKPLGPLGLSRPWFNEETVESLKNHISENKKSYLISAVVVPLSIYATIKIGTWGYKKIFKNNSEIEEERSEEEIIKGILKQLEKEDELQSLKPKNKVVSLMSATPWLFALGGAGYRAFQWQQGQFSGLTLLGDGIYFGSLALFKFTLTTLKYVLTKNEEPIFVKKTLENYPTVFRTDLFKDKSYSDLLRLKTKTSDFRKIENKPLDKNDKKNNYLQSKKLHYFDLLIQKIEDAELVAKAIEKKNEEKKKENIVDGMLNEENINNLDKNLDDLQNSFRNFKNKNFATQENKNINEIIIDENKDKNNNNKQFNVNDVLNNLEKKLNNEN